MLIDESSTRKQLAFYAMFVAQVPVEMMDAADDKELLRLCREYRPPPDHPKTLDGVLQQMKAYALAQMELRKQHQPEHIQNDKLYAGSDMFFYCRMCGWLSDQLPEGFISKPRDVCSECQLILDNGWALDASTITFTADGKL